MRPPFWNKVATTLKLTMLKKRQENRMLFHFQILINSTLSKGLFNPYLPFWNKMAASTCPKLTILNYKKSRKTKWWFLYKCFSALFFCQALSFWKKKPLLVPVINLVRSKVKRKGCLSIFSLRNSKKIVDTKVLSFI